ncbi:MAG: hypothetical protein LBP92_04220 [Deltaproteobacteria bacterium]|nr:hypothetical protein [Deltaproteobacteria bacterium]
MDSIPEGLHYFVDIHGDDRFYPVLPAVSTPELVGCGRKPQRRLADQKPSWASQIIGNGDVPWEEARFGIGCKGPVIGKDKLMRVWEMRDGLPGDQVWLYARKMADGGIRYAISDAPEDTLREKFRELSLRRWSVEQCFEESNSNLGLGHFEGRSWKGWHRHVMIVFVLHMF